MSLRAPVCGGHAGQQSRQGGTGAGGAPCWAAAQHAQRRRPHAAPGTSRRGACAATQTPPGCRCSGTARGRSRRHPPPAPQHTACITRAAPRATHTTPTRRRAAYESHTHPGGQFRVCRGAHRIGLRVLQGLHEPAGAVVVEAGCGDLLFGAVVRADCRHGGAAGDHLQGGLLRRLPQQHDAAGVEAQQEVEALVARGQDGGGLRRRRQLRSLEAPHGDLLEAGEDRGGGRADLCMRRTGFRVTDISREDRFFLNQHSTQQVADRQSREGRRLPI